ncbi:DUF397 domain-containing protein [Saccharopolyspora shandongensis]|uniref:DUF397 domain-containing protein n=1 Tax=Saccharopolyspora shandongensis TaxID=418495 RepID=UPI003429E333
MASTDVDWTQVQFTKSSYSGTDQGNCVELAALAGVVGLRDSKLGTASPVLGFTERQFHAFLAGVKADAFGGRR